MRFYRIENESNEGPYHNSCENKIEKVNIFDLIKL